MNRWVVDGDWYDGRHPHDTVLDLQLTLDPVSAAPAVWAALVRYQGLPLDVGSVTEGGAVARPCAGGLLLRSGGEDALDSLSTLADLVVDACADADVDATGRWVQHPPRSEP